MNTRSYIHIKKSYLSLKKKKDHTCINIKSEAKVKLFQDKSITYCMILFVWNVQKSENINDKVEYSLPRLHCKWRLSANSYEEYCWKIEMFSNGLVAMVKMLCKMIRIKLYINEGLKIMIMCKKVDS